MAVLRRSTKFWKFGNLDSPKFLEFVGCLKFGSLGFGLIHGKPDCKVANSKFPSFPNFQTSKLQTPATLRIPEFGKFGSLHDWIWKFGWFNNLVTITAIQSQFVTKDCHFDRPGKGEEIIAKVFLH